MKRKIEIKNIFLNRLNNKVHTRINNNKSNTSSPSINNNSYQSNIKKIKINSNLYFKPRPIYIISNINKKRNIGINIYRPKKQNFKIKKPQEIETYEVDYNDGNITLTKINTERNKFNFEDTSNKKSGDSTGYNSLRSNSYEFRPFHNTLNIRNFFNYKYEQIKHNYKLDRLNTYNSNTINHDLNTTFDSVYNKHKILNMKYINNLNNNYINNSNRKNTSIDNSDKKKVIKLKSSKSTDIVKLCKFLKNLDSNKKGTFIKENDDDGGIITLKKDSLEKQRQKNKYIINYKKIILIQKWWKDMIFKKYLQQHIINIQKIYRGYKYRKTFRKYIKKLQRYNKPNILNKIIFIQNYWKNYLMNSKLNNINFSFTNNADANINIINSNGVIYIGNSTHKKMKTKTKKAINNLIPYKNIINHCLITKTYYNKVSNKINNIILLQKFIKNYLSIRNKKKHIDNNKIYHKKNFQNNNNNKSRNKKGFFKRNIKRENNDNIYYQYNSKSLVIISPKRELYKFNYNTPNKDKIKRRNLFEESPYSTIYNNCNNYSSLLNKNINDICYMSKNIKDINILNKITYLQSEIKKYIYKYKYFLTKDKIHICYLSKINKKANFKLIQTIIFLQKNIRKYLNNKKHNYDIYKIKEKDKVVFSDDRFKLTNDVSDEKNNDKKRNNNNYISEFNIKDNENKTYDIIIENNKNKDKNENSFISKDVNAFSFDFKDQDNDNNEINNTYTFKDCNSKNSVNINTNDNNENIENIDEDDCNININNNINNIANILNLSYKNRLLYNDRYDSYVKLKNLFVTSITNKLSVFLILILNKLHLFDFIKLLSQKINKSINQYTFNIIFKVNKHITNNTSYDNDIFFFTTLKRHIMYNIKINENNEINSLLKVNIPRYFYINNNNNLNISQNNMNNYYIINIPYINDIQQYNLINSQLFINDDDNLIKYFINFYTNEKDNCILNQNILNHRLIRNKLKNRNIFTITKYMDDIYNDIVNNEKNFNKMKIKQLLINKFNADNTIEKNEYNDKCDGINNEFFKEIDEEINTGESIDNDENNNIINKIYNINDKKNNSYKKNKIYSLSDVFCNNFNNTINQSSYKFIDYLNEKCKNNKLTETLPGTVREITNVDSFKNNI